MQTRIITITNWNYYNYKPDFFFTITNQNLLQLQTRIYYDYKLESMIITTQNLLQVKNQKLLQLQTRIITIKTRIYYNYKPESMTSPKKMKQSHHLKCQG